MLDLAWKLQEQYEIISYILHEGVSICYIKKKEKGPETDFLFLKMIPTFFKSILTSLAIRYSQNVFRGFSILMCIGVQVFFWWLFFSIFTPSLACDSLSRSPPFDRKTVKNCACSSDPGLLNETKGSWFPLSCLSSYQNGW